MLQVTTCADHTMNCTGSFIAFEVYYRSSATIALRRTLCVLAEVLLAEYNVIWILCIYLFMCLFQGSFIYLLLEINPSLLSTPPPFPCGTCCVYPCILYDSIRTDESGFYFLYCLVTVIQKFAMGPWRGTMVKAHAPWKHKDQRLDPQNPFKCQVDVSCHWSFQH